MKKAYYATGYDAGRAVFKLVFNTEARQDRLVVQGFSTTL